MLVEERVLYPLDAAGHSNVCFISVVMLVLVLVQGLVVHGGYTFHLLMMGLSNGGYKAFFG